MNDPSRTSAIEPRYVLGERIARDGFAVVSSVFSRERIEEFRADLEFVLRPDSVEAGSVRCRDRRVYAARNLLQVWPRTMELACEPLLSTAVRAILGDGCGLVRALYFDKPPGRSWSLPWHKDMTIAVRGTPKSSRQFSKPTFKAGVPHVEAPESVLQNMLTARIHLDDVTADNGPLWVIPGSHHDGKTLRESLHDTDQITPIFVTSGDVLLIRPLVTHRSPNSHPATPRHRRIVHLEFASPTPLADGYDWYDFRRINKLD